MNELTDGTSALATEDAAATGEASRSGEVCLRTGSLPNLQALSALSACYCDPSESPLLADRYAITGDLWRCEGNGLTVWVTCDI